MKFGYYEYKNPQKAIKYLTIMLNVFKQLNAKGTTVIIITHDMEVANECNRVIEICDGNIV